MGVSGKLILPKISKYIKFVVVLIFVAGSTTRLRMIY